ncbi:MAG: hypothetical protein ABI467_00150 [Kofleriaceae bacterium]
MIKLLVVAGAAGLVVGGWKLAHRHQVDGDTVQVTDRFWIDHMPKHERDLTHMFVALTHDRDDDNVGFLQFGSRWHAEFNGFRFDRTGGDLAVEFPQNSWKATWHTKVSRCSVGQFTLCLEVTAPRGTFQYFSRDEWVVRSADAGRALEAKLLHDAPRATGAEPVQTKLDEPLAH